LEDYLLRFRNRGPQMKRTSTLAILGIAGFAAFAMDGTSLANTKRHRHGERYSQSRPVETPRLAVIALAQQRISIYSASGKILEARVSTGTTGRETPAGIYSIVQKEEEHHSNLYDDASMPYMERLTWTGMAMHAGPVPGYPASHGCTRLPYGFAQQLYQLTELGMRVGIVREDIAPATIEQPAMFTQTHSSGPDVLPSAKNVTGQLSEAEIRTRLKAAAAAKSEEAQTAIKLESAARSVAAKRAAEAAPAVRLFEAAEANFAKAEADAIAAEQALETASLFERNEIGKTANARAAVQMEAARAQLETAKAQAQVKMNAASQAGEEAKAAAAAMNQAVETAETAKQDASPVSVFVSRKAQRLYIRKGNYPVFEGPLTIRDPDKPIGTFVFTALSYMAPPGRMRWNVVSMYKNATNIEPYSEAKRSSRKNRPAEPADVAGAHSALGRLAIPQDELVPRITDPRNVA
jgi:chemotaxis protein histidine kinase CheA